MALTVNEHRKQLLDMLVEDLKTHEDLHLESWGDSGITVIIDDGDTTPPTQHRFHIKVSHQLSD